MSKKTKKTPHTGSHQTIKGVDLLINSSNKMGRHLGNVKSGTGSHKSAKDYCRKKNGKKSLDNY